MTLKTECIGEPGQNTPSIWDEMEKAREKKKGYGYNLRRRDRTEIKSRITLCDSNYRGD